MKKIGRPAYENAITRTFKLNDGEYDVVKCLVDYLRKNFCYDDLNGFGGDLNILELKKGIKQLSL